MYGAEIQFLCERNFIHHPGQVGGLGSPVDDRSGDGETGSVDRHGRLRKKLSSQSLQAGVVGATDFRPSERRMRPGFVREDRQVSFCTANAPNRRNASLSSTTMKCQGWLFIALPVRRPASTMRRMTSGG